MNRSKLIIIVIAIVIALAGALYWLSGEKKTSVAPADKAPKAKVIQEQLTIPNTGSFTGTEGRVVEPGSVAVPLVPKNEGEKVIVPGAELSVKGAYDLALPAAWQWSPDAELVFIKSLGAITLEGKSSQWQLVFSSVLRKNKGYEIIVQKSQMVSQKEVESAAVGGEIPANFADRDSSWAIAQLADIPQFQTASVTAIVFSYNPDAKGWDYIIPNSFGKSAIRVR